MAKDKDSVMRTVEALLKKAESTNFGPEAEALIQKAHELMARYSIDEAVLHKGQDSSRDVIDIKIKVKQAGAFPDARVTLLSSICRWHRCRTVVTGDFLTVVGFRTDTEFVQLLYTSLVEQMFSALLDDEGYMAALVKVKNLKGVRLKKKAEQDAFTLGASFCDGFTVTVSTKLKEVWERLEQEVKGTGTDLVLFDRSKLVDRQVKDLFPNLGKYRVRQYAYDHGAAERGKEAGRNADVGATRVGGSRAALNE